MTFSITSPIDNTPYYKGELHTVQDIQTVLATAESVRMSWASTPLKTRKKLMLKMAEELQNMGEILGKDIAHCMGRPYVYAKKEVKGFMERTAYLARIAKQGLSPHMPDSPAGFDLQMHKQPLGNIAIISPWNYPLLTASSVMASAILAGNTVILKHSLQTATIAEHMATACKKAGFPEGVFQILHLTHDHTKTLVADKRIHGVYFTGSVEGGRKIQQALTEKFIPCGLELGGKDPAFVRADAHMDSTCENLVDGAFFNSGQSCCSIERIYVHKDIYDTFVTKFVERTNQYILGNPMDDTTTIGPMVTTAAADFVRRQIADAMAQGATALIDEAAFPMSKAGTPYLAPQVLINVTHNMDIMTQESFGPVVGIMAVDSDDHAISLMNDSDFGLTASIWTQDIATATKMLPHIETGTAFINRCDYLSPMLAWTGVKNTGRGISLSVLGFDQVTRVKSYHIKHTL